MNNIKAKLSYRLDGEKGKAMNIQQALPFLVVSGIVLVLGSMYYLFTGLLRQKPPKRIEYTVVNYVNFR